MSISAIIIEDNIKFAEILKESLEKHDIKIRGVLTEFDGAEEYILSNPVDFLLVDIHLTEECKAEGIEIIKNVSNLIESNIVILTNFVHNDLINKAFEYGAVAYEDKLRFENLPMIMKSILENVYPTKCFSDLYKKEKEKNFFLRFTNIEKKIISFLRKGYSVKKIAESEYKSVETIKSQVRGIRKKADGDLRKVSSCLQKLK